MAEVTTGASGNEAADHVTEAAKSPIGRICLVLLKDFINYNFNQRDVTDGPEVEETGIESKLSAEEQESCKNIGLQLQKIGDQFQKDTELKRQIDCTYGKSRPKIESIVAVAKVLFGDKLNWGRILALFYFAFEMCLRAVKNSLTGSGSESGDIRTWIKELIIEVTILVIEQFGKWIIKQGGWNAILTYFNDNTTPATAFVSGLAIAAVAITVIYVIYRLNKK